VLQRAPLSLEIPPYFELHSRKSVLLNLFSHTIVEFRGLIQKIMTLGNFETFEKTDTTGTGQRIDSREKNRIACQMGQLAGGQELKLFRERLVTQLWPWMNICVSHATRTFHAKQSAYPLSKSGTTAQGSARLELIAVKKKFH
jgi:hypothetical protein